ncbi:helix-turn-helix transcriptional regulator [Streptomyces sp. NPDC090025]|uniref:helix-turn-helix transcriptional regulator n=1 Tax=Streptomyces sp. NPDC090025 TaxID=3365922 RepID=UPI00383395A6
MDLSSELSEFLRTRRARLKPQDVGLPEFGRHRRVPGLRREELAQLAGVSVAYYTRLEQGNGKNVSMEVLDSIARALRLSDTERAHLTHLAKPTVKKRQRAAAARPQKVRPGLAHLLEAMETVPAFVLGRRGDILAWNRMSRALFGDFDSWEPHERNMARMIFLDPNSRDLYPEWECKAVEVVSVLRLYAGMNPDDQELLSLVGELSVRSEEFRSLWAAHTVTDKGHGSKRVRHPLVGEMTLAYESLKVSGDDPDLMLVTYHAEPGSASADALRLLAQWGVDEPAKPADVPE